MSHVRLKEEVTGRRGQQLQTTTLEDLSATAPPSPCWCRCSCVAAAMIFEVHRVSEISHPASNASTSSDPPAAGVFPRAAALQRRHWPTVGEALSVEPRQPLFFLRESVRRGEAMIYNGLFMGLGMAGMLALALCLGLRRCTTLARKQTELSRLLLHCLVSHCDNSPPVHQTCHFDFVLGSPLPVPAPAILLRKGSASSSSRGL